MRHNDHLVIKFKLALETPETLSNSASRTARYKWFKADFDDMQTLGVDWQPMVYYL